MADQQLKHVFISYVRENQDQVDRLCEDLERSGVNVWLDRNSIKPGARWKDAIRQAIRHGDFFIACFSDEYTSKTKSYMNAELTLAINELQEYDTNREWFIPVLLSECDVPARSIGAGDTLLDINWVPLYEDWGAGVQKILSVIKPIPLRIQNFISALCSEDGDVREAAARALGKIGPKAKDAVPALIKALKDEHAGASLEASDALANIGSEAAPTLIEALKDEDKAVRLEAANVLEKIGPKAVLALVKALRIHDRGVHRSAAEVLAYIGPDAVSALVEALKDEDEDFWVRWEAAATLANIGPEAVLPLIEVLHDRDPIVRWRAAHALGIIYPKAMAAVPALSEALIDKKAVVRNQAAEALANIGLEARTAVPVLAKALKDKDKDVRKSAKLALEKINTPEAQKTLEEYKKKSAQTLNQKT